MLVNKYQSLFQFNNGEETTFCCAAGVVGQKFLSDFIKI